MKFWRFKKKWIEAVLAFAMTAVLAGCAWQGTAISEEGGLLTKTGDSICGRCTSVL